MSIRFVKTNARDFAYLECEKGSLKLLHNGWSEFLDANLLSGVTWAK
jgi:hypothetical protein